MDDDIIQEVLDGNIQAFRHLISKYKTPSFNLASSILKSGLCAEEAVQDAFVKAYQQLHRFKKRASFSTWLYRIVVNESLRKANKKKLDHVEIDLNENIHQPYTIEPDAIEHLHVEEQKELINTILDELNPAECLLLKLFYLEEKKMQEISVITGYSIANIKVTLHRGRKHFAHHYHQKNQVKTEDYGTRF